MAAACTAGVPRPVCLVRPLAGTSLDLVQQVVADQYTSSRLYHRWFLWLPNVDMFGHVHLSSVGRRFGWAPVGIGIWVKTLSGYCSRPATMAHWRLSLHGGIAVPVHAIAKTNPSLLHLVGRSRGESPSYPSLLLWSSMVASMDITYLPRGIDTGSLLPFVLGVSLCSPLLLFHPFSFFGLTTILSLGFFTHYLLSGARLQQVAMSSS